MSKFLVTFNDDFNYIDLNGFVVMTDRDVLSFEELATSITWPFVYEFNEGYELEFSNGEDLLSRISFKEISAEEAKVIKNLFSDEFGFFIDEIFLRDIIAEEDYDDDDDEEDYEDDEYDEYDSEY